jgi:hypothetical protein
MRNMSRVLIKLLAVLVIILGGAYACAYAVLRERCTATVMAETISPDDSWKAIVDHTFCESPIQTYAVAAVRLISLHNPAKSAVVLGVPAENVDQRPDIVWTGPQTLQATVRSSVTVNALMCEFEGVRIEIRFPPDEAGRRAAWHHQQGEPDPGADVASTSPCP